MPFETRKRKAAVSRWITRKKNMLDSAQDQIRFSVPLANPALCEMAQPNDKIEDHYLGTSAISGHSSCSSDYSDSIPDVPLPTTANENGTDSCEELDKFSISLAELPIMDLEELSLPEMPLDTFATDWLVLEDDETAELYGGSSIIVPAEDPPLFTEAEQNDQPGSSAYNVPVDMQIIHSVIAPRKVNSGQFSVTTCGTNYPKELSVESAPLSPLLAAADEEKRHEKECSMASFEDLTADQQFIRLDCLQREAPGNGMWPANDGIETHYDSAPAMPCASEKDERITFSPLRLIGISNNPLLDSTTIPTTRTSPIEPSLVIDDELLTSRRFNLTRSKTTIIDIPGRPPGSDNLGHLNCYCAACIKCAEFQQKLESQVSVKNTSKHEIQKDDTTEARMRELYDQFNGLELPAGIYDPTRSFVATATTEPRKTAATARRYQGANASEYLQVDIPKWKKLIGRRIIDYDYFVKWTITAQAVHSRYCLGVLCPQQEVVKSMVSTLWLMCNVCSIIVKGTSEEPSRGTRLRFCISWAILNTGSTYAMAQEFFSFLDIPFMGRQAFFKDETAMDIVLEAALQESLNKAVQEELRLASQELKDKQLSENTPPSLSCELDGSWGQRSYGHRYTSASGCAAMVGTRSKKVVYIGTRNKRCSACNRNTARLKANKKITKHKCYKNYSGASGGMESDIIIEGFQKLYEKGIKFTTVITDGDSTTVSKLKNNCAYGHEIKQLLCCNHTLKNAGKKLREIKLPKQFADQVTSRLDRITKDVRSAIKHCADTGSIDVEGLRYDIRNVPYHVFDKHSDCRDYFCVHKSGTNNTPSIILDLQKSGVWDKITVLMEKLASKAESLCENKTSNLAENLFCRLCKYNVGKRVDTMSRGSYQRRVQITALMCNENYTWHNVYMKTFTGEAPGFWTRKMFAERMKSLERTRKAQNNSNFSRRSKNVQRDKELDYGEEAIEAAENAATESAVIDVDAMRLNYQIQTSTKEQLTRCITITEMEELAKGRILSKFVPEIINARESTKWKKCELLLQTTNTWNLLKSNRAVVGLVLRVLKDQHSLTLGEGQMFVDACHQFLCCVPDAVSKDGSMILLIRKKESTGNIKEQASKPRGVLGCKLKDGVISLDRNTTMEIQAALHICSSTQCLIFFMFGSNVSNHLFTIVDKDDDFFETKVEQKLNGFFDDYFLKTLVKKQITVKQ